MIHKTICSCLVKPCTHANVVATPPIHNGKLEKPKGIV
jgi:hypothetical protein